MDQLCGCLESLDLACEQIGHTITEVNKALLSAARGGRPEALYVLAIHTGSRRSEILGLKWTDVDLEAAPIGKCHPRANSSPGDQTAFLASIATQVAPIVRTTK